MPTGVLFFYCLKENTNASRTNKQRRKCAILFILSAKKINTIMSTKKITISSVLIGSLFGSIHGGHYAFAYGPLEPRIKLHKFDEFLETKEIDDRSILSEKKRFLASRSTPIRAGPLLRSKSYAGQALL
jgi:hypothetical protein